MMDPSRPHPRRFWWLTRLSIAAAAVLLTVGGLRVYWGQVMHRQFEAAIAEVRAAGEPIDFEDMLRDPVPDADNAVRYYRDAFAAWPTVDDPTTGTPRIITETAWHSAPDQHDDPITDNAAYLDAIEPALSLLRQAAAAPDADWDVQLTSPVIDMLLPNLSEARRYARLIEDAAQRAHDVGRHDLAFELIEHLLDLSHAVEAPPHTLLGRLVGISIRAMAVSRLERLTPTLQIGAEPGAASPEQVDHLITRLLDEDVWRGGFHAGYEGERWASHDAVMAIYGGRMALSALAGGSPGSFDATWLRNLLIGPMLIREANVMLRWHTTNLAAIEVADTQPQYTRYVATHAPFNLDDLDWQQPWHYPLLTILMPAVDAAVSTDFRARTNQLMAATVLAIRRFELDHGQRPATLEELVPDYLPHVPRDPMAESDEPIRYLPGGASVRVADWRERPDPVDESDLSRPAIVYSVGTNHEDDGGLLIFDGDGKLEKSRRYQPHDLGGDQFFLLDPWPEPVREPSSNSTRSWSF